MFSHIALVYISIRVLEFENQESIRVLEYNNYSES